MRTYDLTSVFQRDAAMAKLREIYQAEHPEHEEGEMPHVRVLEDA